VIAGIQPLFATPVPVTGQTQVVERLQQGAPLGNAERQEIRNHEDGAANLRYTDAAPKHLENPVSQRNIAGQQDPNLLAYQQTFQAASLKREISTNENVEEAKAEIREAKEKEESGEENASSDDTPGQIVDKVA
jgi:hypothetical protein